MSGPSGTAFDLAALKSRAMNATGLDDFGPEPLDDGMSVACFSLENEAGLNAAGRALFAGDIVSTLSERLRLQDWFTRHPPS